MMEQHYISIVQENDYIFERILWRVNYFWCGHSSEPYYNIAFAKTMEIIGKYCNPGAKNSNYHNGISYISKQVGVSKTQVKAIRKKMKLRKGYEFKTSYYFAQIIAVTIQALKSCEDKPELKRLMEDHTYYRDMIAFKQYNSIKNAANCGDKRIRKIESTLDQMQEKFHK